MTQEAVMVIGLPASGKTSHSQGLIDKGYVHLNRDKIGGKIVGLLPHLDAALKDGKSVVLDNLFPTADVRRPFLEACARAHVPIRCIWVATSAEDAQINALHRMWKKHGKIFCAPEDLKGVKCPNTFPIAVIFKYKKEFEKPDKSEGFSKIEKVKFVRRPLGYKNEAVIFDYDETLRTSTHEKLKFPTKPGEVKLLPGRKEIKKLVGDRMMLGVSNQSGVARGQLSREDAVACFEETNRQLGVTIEYHFCEHNVPPRCYCRKPQSGLGVLLIEKHKLNPEKCIYIGDQTTDKTFAKRLGFQYMDAEEFFKG